MGLLLASGAVEAPPAAPTFTVYPAGSARVLSPDYAVTIEGQDSPVYTATVNVSYREGGHPETPKAGETDRRVFEDHSWTIFDTSGPCTLLVTILDSRTVTSARVLPSRHGAVARVLNGKQVEVTIPYPWAAFELQLNHLAGIGQPRHPHESRPLWIFARPMQAPPPAPGPNVTIWSRTGGPGGGGVHNVGEIDVVSGHTYYIEGGAQVNVRFRATSEQSNWTVRGRGTIQRPGNVVWCSTGAHDWELEGIVIVRDGRTDPGDWTIKPQRNWNIRIIDTAVFTNTVTMDGTDFQHCHDALLSGAFRYSCDDPWCINGIDGVKVLGRDHPLNQIYNITIKDSVATSSTCVGIGMEIGGSMECLKCYNILYSNIDVIHGYGGAALSIRNQDSADVNDVVLDGIYIEDYRGYNYNTLLVLNVSKGGWSNDEYIPGKIRNVTFRNVHYFGETAVKKGEIRGYGPDNKVGGPGTDGIRFQNVTYGGALVTSLAGLGITTNTHVENVTFA